MIKTSSSALKRGLLALLLSSMSPFIWGQEPAQPEESLPEFKEEERRFPGIDLPDPGETLTLELVIHRWGESAETSQSFTIALSNIPRFLSQAELSESRIEFDQDTSEIPLQLNLVSKEGQEASDEDLVIDVLSEDESVVPQKRKLVIPLKSRPSTADSEEEEIQANYDFVVRTWKEDYKNPSGEDRFDHILQIHDEDVELYTVDPVFLCFTATAREVDFMYYKIYGPDGEVYQEGINDGDSNSSLGWNTINEIEGAPYEVILPLAITYFTGSEDLLDNQRIRKPGEYRLEVAKPIYQDQGLFGIPTNPKPGEWVTVGSFTVNEPVFHFNGTASLVFPTKYTNDERNPYLALNPTTGGISGSATLTLEWDDEHANEATRQWEPVFMQKEANFNFEFPSTITYGSLDTMPATSSNLTFEESEYWSVNFSTHYGLYIYEDDGELVEPEDNTGIVNTVARPSFSILKSETTKTSGQVTTNQEYRFSEHTSIMLGRPISPSENTLGWMLRSPGVRYAMEHRINASAVIASLGSVFVMGLYSSEQGELSTVELTQRSRTMERPDRDRKPEEEESDSNSDQDRSQDDRTGTPQGTLADGNPGSGSGGRDGLGSGQDGLGSGNGSGNGGAGGDGQGGPIDPNLIDPNSPDIAGLIATWISIAEPPMNATHGASLRYNDWGVMHGTTHQGRITETPGKPDEVGLRSSPEYLWQEQRDLDSVDHCTLGEYVINSLSGASMAHCAGRYQPLPRFNVPQVVGMTMDQAESRLTGESLTPEWVTGPPAPNDRLTGTVASQFPAQGSEVLEGDAVTLEIYIEPIRLVTLPDVLGKPIDIAERELQALGLEVVLELGDPAQSAAQQFTVQLQTPISGEQVDEASSVTLAVYSDYIPEISMPDLVGQLMDEANQTLTSLELEIELAVGEPASSAESNNRVQSQTPLPGTILYPGDTTTLTVFSDYVPPPTVRVPSVIGMNMNQLANTLKQSGLVGRWRKGEPAPSPNQAQTVYKQTPAAGTEVLEGSDVVVDMYDDAPAVVVNTNPVPTAGGNTRPPPTGTGNNQPSQTRADLPYLQPVQKLVVPGTLQGIRMNTGKEVMTRNDYQQWLLGDKTTHRTTMVAYGNGDPFGNFFEDDTDDTTHFLAIAAWLEQGDSWGANPQYQPPNKDGVERKTGSDIFLNGDNDAAAYFYSKKGVPATVIIMVSNEKQSLLNSTVRQEYADDIFEQLLGNEKQPATSSSSASPSAVSQFTVTQKLGDYSSIELSPQFSTVLRKEDNEWMHPEFKTRYATVSYEGTDFRKDQLGKNTVEIFWLENQDTLTTQNQAHFNKLTNWNPSKHTPSFGNVPIMQRLHDGPLYYHSPDKLISMKFSSTSQFLNLRYTDIEPFTDHIISQLGIHAKPRPNGYQKIQRLNLPSKFQELIGGGSVTKFVQRPEHPGNWSRGGYPTSITDHGKGFSRGVSFRYWTGNFNKGGTGESGLFGIPSGNVQFAENDEVWIKVFWVEQGDPFHPDLKQAFKGTDTYISGRRYPNTDNDDIIFYSSRVAAIVEFKVENGQGSQRFQACQAFANQMFRQLEGRALHPSKIPTSAVMK